MSRFSFAVAIGIISLSSMSGMPAFGGVLDCDRDEAGMIAKLPPGRQPYGSAHFVYESWVKQEPYESKKYTYCITNNRPYVRVDVEWRNTAGLLYFDQAVPPIDEREQSYPSIYPHEISNRDIEYGRNLDKNPGIEIERETVFSTNETASVSKDQLSILIALKQPPSLNQYILEFGQFHLVSKATFDIPANAEVQTAIAKDVYKNYSPKDFITVTVFFDSSIKLRGTMLIISNKLEVQIHGDVESAFRGLRNLPVYFKAMPESLNEYLVGKTSLSERGIRIMPHDENAVGPRILISETVYPISKPLDEHKAQLAIFDVDGTKLVSMVVSYFAPIT